MFYILFALLLEVFIAFILIHFLIKASNWAKQKNAELDKNSKLIFNLLDIYKQKVFSNSVKLEKKLNEHFFNVNYAEMFIHTLLIEIFKVSFPMFKIGRKIAITALLIKLLINYPRIQNAAS